MATKFKQKTTTPSGTKKVGRTPGGRWYESTRSKSGHKSTTIEGKPGTKYVKQTDPKFKHLKKSDKEAGDLRNDKYVVKDSSYRGEIVRQVKRGPVKKK